MRYSKSLHVAVASLSIAIGLTACQSSHTEGPATLSASSEPPPAMGKEDYPQPEDAKLRSYLELARRDLQFQKAAIIADNIEFTDAEGAEFWPIYREYEADLYRINSRRLDLVRRFLPSAQNMTDDQARSLAKEVFDIEDARTGLKRNYFAKFQKVIPATKAARFLQIENQLNMILDLRIAAALPLIK
jgi:hypothetical protein